MPQLINVSLCIFHWMVANISVISLTQKALWYEGLKSAFPNSVGCNGISRDFGSCIKMFDTVNSVGIYSFQHLGHWSLIQYQLNWFDKIISELHFSGKFSFVFTLSSLNQGLKLPAGEGTWRGSLLWSSAQTPTLSSCPWGWSTWSSGPWLAVLCSTRKESLVPWKMPKCRPCSLLPLEQWVQISC